MPYPYYTPHIVERYAKTANHIPAKRLFDRADNKGSILNKVELTHMRNCAECLELFAAFIREFSRERKRDPKELSKPPKV